MSKNLSFQVGKSKYSQILYDLGDAISTVIPSSVSENGTDMAINLDQFETMSDYAWRTLRNDIASKYNHAMFNMIIEEGVVIPDDLNDSIYKHNRPSRILFALSSTRAIDQETYRKYVIRFTVDSTGEKIFDESIRNIVNTIGTEPVTPLGRFTKRFSTYIQQMYDYKMQPSYIEHLGNMYNECKITNKEFYVKVTNNFNWKDGYFGHENSCWWASFTHSRDTLYHYGGYAVLFYPNTYDIYDSDGIGRVWLYPVSDNVFITFNSYGVQPKESAAVVSKLLEKLTGVSWKYGKRSVNNTGGDSHYPYINGDNGTNESGGSKCYAIYTGATPDSSIEIHMQQKFGYFVTPLECRLCSAVLDEDYAQEIHGDVYCDSCVSREFWYCNGCDLYYRRSNRTPPHHFADDTLIYYCRSCIEDVMSYHCTECGRYYRHNTDLVFVPNPQHTRETTACRTCADANYEHCDVHDRYHSSNRICPECSQSIPEETPF